MKQIDSVAELYDNVVLAAKTHVGGEKGFSIIGPNFRRAMVALEIVALQQRMRNMGVGEETLVETTDAMVSELNDQFPWED